MAHFMRGDIEKAYDDFTAALCLDGGAEKACYFRGIASWALGRLDEAHMDFSQSLDRNPLQAEVLVCRALLRCQMGDSAGALADSEQVLAIAPDSAEARDLQDLLTVEVVNDAGELGP
jgi:tetratricopeptide (TPR) repeat protein